MKEIHLLRRKQCHVIVTSFSRRQRSLSHEVNSDPSNPVLNFVQDMINESERSSVPLEHKDLKNRVDIQIWNGSIFKAIACDQLALSVN